MEKFFKKSLLQGLLGVMVLLVCIFYWKPLVWLLISAAVMLLSFILAQSGRGREQWLLLPLLILTLGLAPRLCGDMLPTPLIPWVGGIAGIGVLGVFIVGLFISLPPQLGGLPAFLAGLSSLLIWGEYPQVWPLYFWGAIVFGAIGIALIFVALGRELRQGGVAPLLLVPMALLAQTIMVWAIGSSFMWILVSGALSLLGFCSGLLWESRAEIRKNIQALYEEVIEGWKDFFSIARDEQ